MTTRQPPDSRSHRSGTTTPQAQTHPTRFYLVDDLTTRMDTDHKMRMKPASLDI
jgi:hypothetical protein